MSYAKKGLDGSDVYVFRGLGLDAPDYVVVTPESAGLVPNYRSILICHECSLMPATPGGEWDHEHFESDSADAMLAHLERHQAHGHSVPAAAIARLRAERMGS